MKTIEITIAPNGQTQIETKGFTGSECRDASRLLEQALGVQASETLKAEFFQSASAQQSLQQGQ